MMKKNRFKPKPGLNFKKMVRRLSNNALKYLITVGNQEASYRNLKISIPNLGEDLPSIQLTGNQIIDIRDQNWLIKAYTIEAGEWKTLSDGETVTIDVENENWYEKYKDKNPISIKLTTSESPDEKIIEFHSRSKIFWFAKLIEPYESGESNDDEDEVDFESDLKWD